MPTRYQERYKNFGGGLDLLYFTAIGSLQKHVFNSHCSLPL
jgi:hypothetical protein